MLAALGERDRELGGARVTGEDRARVRRQAAHVLAWSLVAGVALTIAAAWTRGAP